MDNQNIEKRVGSLETGMARVVTALESLKSLMDDVRTQVTNSRPSFWVLVPSILAFAGMLISGVIAVAALRSDITGLSAVQQQRELELQRMHSEIETLEARQWDELRRDRDYWRYGGNHGQPAE